jgi:hypothetical protein
MNATPSDGLNKFHLSLNVSNLQRSLQFYKLLFDLEPAKSYPDYAKFELVDPPVIMSLVPRAPSPGTAMCSVGFRMQSRSAVMAARDRIEKAGLTTQTQECTNCGYTEQLRVHVGDPDGNYWCLYAIDRHIAPDSLRQSLEGPAATLLPNTSVQVWEHFATHPLPDRIPHADASLDEVRLLGSLNQIEDADKRAFLIGEAMRALRPGGALIVHGLMAERSLPNGAPTLSGRPGVVFARCVLLHRYVAGQSDALHRGTTNICRRGSERKRLRSRGGTRDGSETVGLLRSRDAGRLERRSNP